MSRTDAALIGTKEASELLGESIKSTIRRVEKDELTPVTKLPGLRGAYLFNRADVLALTPTAPAVDSTPESTTGAFSVPPASQ